MLYPKMVFLQSRHELMIKKMKSRESKIDVLGVLGVMGFYSTYIVNVHVDAKCLYEMANSNDKFQFQWLPCHEEIFQKLKDKFCHGISKAIPNVLKSYTRRLLKCTIRVYTHQRFSRRKENCFCYSRVFGKAEQKMSSQHRELCGIISTLQTYESYIIGSPLPLYLYCDHRPNLLLWSRKGQFLIDSSNIRS